MRLSKNKLFLGLVCLVSFAVPGSAKVVKASVEGSCAAALTKCVSGDVLILDMNCPGEMLDPPSDLQIVSGSATWKLTKDVSNLVFFAHSPVIKQSGGIIKKAISTSLARPSSFVGVDSCTFMCQKMSRDWVNYEINGFLRHSSFLFPGHYMGTSGINFLSPFPQGGDTWKSTNIHNSCMLINATDRVGDGSGTLVTGIITHGQVNWTPVHIVNGRGITLSHINGEYCEGADPFVRIDNGVECMNLNHAPGGQVPKLDWAKYITLTDGTRSYAGMTNCYGAWRIGGMNNSFVSGTQYVPGKYTYTGHGWSAFIARDPYLTKWFMKPDQAIGINFAPGLKAQSIGSADPSVISGDIANSGYVFNSTARCTTHIINDSGKIITSGLKPKSVRAGEKFFRPYFSRLPRIKLDGAGPGENFTGKTGADIVAAMTAGKTIYLPAGTYNIPGTIKGGTIFGAGKDQTILKFPAGVNCVDQRIGLYNLTIEGGKVGYVQSTGYQHDFSGANVRFRGQSLAGMNFGCSQNTGIQFVEFDNCNVGITCCQDGIRCGENGTGGGKILDKFEVYGCEFRNLTSGAYIRGGTDGFPSFVGCLFENISGTAITLSCKGSYVTATDFVNCALSINSTYHCVVTGCSIQGRSDVASTGVKGSIEVLGSTEIKNCAIAAEVSGSAFVSDVHSDGELKYPKDTWVALSSFKNIKCLNSAYYGPTDLTPWIDNDPIYIDQTPPTAPTNVSVTNVGGHNKITWSPSSDPETRIMAYIIIRNNIEIGRTIQKYPSRYHAVPSLYGPTGYPGAGLYRDPTCIYIDSNSTVPAGDYKVVAVNFAQIRSDNTMARIRFWHSTVSPLEITGKDASGNYYLKTDSVTVPLGSLVHYNGKSGAAGTPVGVSYLANHYAPCSQSGVKKGIAPDPICNASVGPIIPPNTDTFLGVAVSQPMLKHLQKLTLSNVITIYNLKGAKIASVDRKAMMSIGEIKNFTQKLKVPSGIYVVPELGYQFNIVQ